MNSRVNLFSNVIGFIIKRSTSYYTYVSYFSESCLWLTNSYAETMMAINFSYFFIETARLNLPKLLANSNNSLVSGYVVKVMVRLPSLNSFDLEGTWGPRFDSRFGQSWGCGRQAAGCSPSDQDQARVDGALCSTLTWKSCHHKRRGPIPGQLSEGVARTIQTWYRGPGQPGQFKEWAGFLVSRSLTLPAAPPWAGAVIG